MRQPWIISAKPDLFFIILPPFLVWLFVLVFHKNLEVAEAHYSFYIWLFLIVFVDVAHVYSTLFKTYFVREEFRKRRLLYLGIPALSFVVGLSLFQLGSLVFWSVLALVAVFHFVRQQYGFMRLYARFEANNFYKKIDGIAIYSATIYPMIFWILTPRKFNWFVENEFSWLKISAEILPIFTWIYWAVLLLWLGKTICFFVKFKTINIPKNLLILGTFLSWYFGIIFYNNDLIFTLLNVISHGVPYVALIYLNEIKKNDAGFSKRFPIFKTAFGVFLFLGTIIFLAFSEEAIWEIFVWRENLSIKNFRISDFWLAVWCPFSRFRSSRITFWTALSGNGRRFKIFFREDFQYKFENPVI